jgi:hypothetical protein
VSAEPEPKAKPLRQMPRPAIKAIAWSGHFCGVMTCFLVYFAVRHGFHPVLIALNAATAAFLFAGSAWMQWQLVRRP